MATTQTLRVELRSQISEAERRGVPYVDINSGELHRQLGGYPGLDHSMPSCCNVMHEERRAGDQILSSPPKGRGASLTIRYQLPRQKVLRA